MAKKDKKQKKSKKDEGMKNCLNINISAFGTQIATITLGCKTS